MRLSPPRAVGFMATVLSLLSGAVYNIAITRKLTLDYLGLLNIVNSAVAFSSLPVTIPSFTRPGRWPRMDRSTWWQL